MGWYRTHRRFWGIAALVALTLQIALSFGHVHGFETHSDAATVIAGTGGSTSPSPSDRTGQHDENYCATYAILALLTGAQIANAPAVAPPAVLIAAEILFTFDAIRISASPASFRARAPPF